MLPRCRTAGEPFVISAFDVQVSDVEGFMDELQEFQSVFHDCFARSEARAHFLDYMIGQYSPLARKSIEPIALAVEGSSIRSLQRFLIHAAANFASFFVFRGLSVNESTFWRHCQLNGG
jgi:hypothetical protein